MSVMPIPVHISCFGVSADAVTMARGYSKHSYSERLASVRTAIQAAPNEPASAAKSHATSDVLTPAAPQAARTKRQAPDVKLRPVEKNQATQNLAVSTPSSSGVGPPTNATSLNPSSMLNYRAHTKHSKVAAPPLQALDFISIAVNSVGGGGVPRPYGKFQASRCGDGNATWERLPPQPGSWQARALPVAVTLLGDSHTGRSQTGSGTGTGTGSPADTAARPLPAPKPTSRSPVPHTGPPHGTRRVTEPPSGGKGSSSSDISDLRLGFGAFGQGPRRSQTTPTPRAPSPSSTQSGPSSGAPAGRAVTGGCGSPPTNPSGGRGSAPPRQMLHEQSYYRRPGSTAHRGLVPLPPPEPHYAAAWFALPAATFLTEVPPVPEHLRMDNGYSVSREFLMSGLNPPKVPSPAPLGPPLLTTPPVAVPSTCQTPTEPQQPSSPQQHTPRDERRVSGFHQPHPEARVEDKRVLWEALEQGGHVAAHGGGGGMAAPGLRSSKLRGVYVPIEKRLAGAAESVEQVLEAGSAALTAIGSSRMAIQLPAEHTLPRRNVPQGW